MEKKKIIYGVLGFFIVSTIISWLFLWWFFSMMNPDKSVDNNRTQTFEVQTTKGIVQLHLGMPKDSVILLLGEPDGSSARSLENTIKENIYYSTIIKGGQLLDLDFENGTLDHFSQSSY